MPQRALRRTVSQPATRLELAVLRRRFGVTQQQIADALGVTQRGVLKLEGSRDPRVSTVRRYVDALASQLGVDANLELRATVGGQAFSLDAAEIGATSPRTSFDAAIQGAPKHAVSSSRTAWRLRAWDDPDLEDRFVSEGLIAISDDEVGDLTRWPGDEDLRRRLRNHPPFAAKPEQAIGTFVRYWRYFRVDIQRADLVVVPRTGRRAAIAEVVGDYEYNSGEANPKLRHRREVRWLGTWPRSALPGDIVRVVNAPGTICRVNAPAACERLLALRD